MSKKTIEDYLLEADDAAEGANYHEFNGLAQNLFDVLKNLVDSEHHVTLARNIFKTIIAQI